MEAGKQAAVVATELVSALFGAVCEPEKHQPQSTTAGLHAYCGFKLMESNARLYPLLLGFFPVTLNLN